MILCMVMKKSSKNTALLRGRMYTQNRVLSFQMQGFQFSECKVIISDRDTTQL